MYIPTFGPPQMQLAPDKENLEELVQTAREMTQMHTPVEWFEKELKMCGLKENKMKSMLSIAKRYYAAKRLEDGVLWHYLKVIINTQRLKCQTMRPFIKVRVPKNRKDAAEKMSLQQSSAATSTSSTAATTPPPNSVQNTKKGSAKSVKTTKAVASTPALPALKPL